MEYMKTIPDKFFDLAVSDPPYGINSGKINQRLNHGCGKLKNRLLNQSDFCWDNQSPGKEYFEELFRVSRNCVIWGGNYFDLPPSRCIVVWDKMQPWENFSQVEIAWTSFDYPAKLFSYCNTGGQRDGETKIHPTQKPIALYDYIFKTFAKEGDKIFDSHMGSQSSRISAWKAGLDYYGCEINEMYYKLGEERFVKYSAQMNLFID